MIQMLVDVLPLCLDNKRSGTVVHDEPNLCIGTAVSSTSGPNVVSALRYFTALHKSRFGYLRNKKCYLMMHSYQAVHSSHSHPIKFHKKPPKLLPLGVKFVEQTCVFGAKHPVGKNNRANQLINCKNIQHYMGLKIQ